MERDRKNWILVDSARSRANPSILVRDRERRTTSPYDGATVEESRLQTINRLNNRIQKRFVEQEFYSDYGVPKISPEIPDESMRVSNPYISQTDSQGEIEAVFEKRGPSSSKQSSDPPRRIERRPEEDVYVLQNEPIYSKMPTQISFDDVAEASTSNLHRDYQSQYYVNEEELQKDKPRERWERRRKTESRASDSLRVKRRFAPPPSYTSRYRVQPLPDNTIYDYHQRDHNERIYSTSREMRESREYARRNRNAHYSPPEEYRRYPPKYELNVDYTRAQPYTSAPGHAYRDDGYHREPIYSRGAGYSPRRAAYQHTLRRTPQFYDKCDMCAFKWFRPGDYCPACGRGSNFPSRASTAPSYQAYAAEPSMILDPSRLTQDYRRGPYGRRAYVPRGAPQLNDSYQQKSRPVSKRPPKSPVFRYGSSMPEALYDYEVWARKEDRKRMMKRVVGVAFALLAISIIVSAGVVLAAINY